MTKKPRYIKARDEEGRLHSIPRAQFEEHYLHESLFEAYNDPVRLEQLIHLAAEQGFAHKLDDACRRLITISEDPADATLLRAFILNYADRMDEGKALLEEWQAEHGTQPHMQGMLAMYEAETGDREAAQKMMREALQGDPNYLPALSSFLAMKYEDGGDQAHSLALEEVKKFEGAWLPQLMQACVRIGNGNHFDPVDVVRSVIPSAQDQPQILLMVAGCFHECKRFDLLTEIIAPQYKPEAHPPDLGSAIIASYMMQERIDEAKVELDRIYKKLPQALHKELEWASNALYPKPWYKKLAALFTRR